MERLTTEYCGEYVPRKLCSVDRLGGADDCDLCCEYCNATEEGVDCKECAINECFNKLGEYENLEEQGKLLKLPCTIGDTVYILGTCEEVENILDGTMYGENGEPGTATGYYCPYYLNENCPHENCDDCEECREKVAVFEDEVKGFGVYEGYIMLYTKNLNYCADVKNNFGKTVFLTKEEAEQVLKEREKNDSH